MTRTQYNAILEIAENGERFAPHDLNVSARTLNSLVKKGYVRVIGYVSFVTSEGWKAVASI